VPAEQLTAAAMAKVADEMASGEVGFIDLPPVALLRERVASAVENVPFYRDLYRDYLPVPEGPSFLPWFQSLPLIRKSQLQQAGPAALLNQLRNRVELVEKPTSGSTGIPFKLYLDPTLIEFRKWRMQRAFQRSLGQQSKSSLVFLFPWDFVSRTVLGTREGSGADQRDAAEMPTSSMERAAVPGLGPDEDDGDPVRRQKKGRRNKKVATQVAGTAPLVERPITINAWLKPDEIHEALEAIRPKAIIGFASTIDGVATWMTERGLTLETVERIWSTSEIMSPTGANATRKAFGCDPLAIYASNEFGFMGWQEENDGPIMLDSDHLYVEFADREANGSPGVQGASIVVTDLLNDTTPLIRYDIEDVAVAGPALDLAPGQSVATMSSFQGKVADIVSSRSGTTISPLRILAAVRGALPEAQYRVVVDNAAFRMIVQYRPGREFDERNLDKVATALAEILGPDFSVLTQQVDEIVREPSGKLRPLVNLANVSLDQRRGLIEALGIDRLLPAGTPDELRLAIDRVVRSVMRGGEPNNAFDEDSELYGKLGIDSLRFVKLISRLEQEIGVDIEDEDLLDEEIVTMGNLYQFVSRLVDGRGLELVEAAGR
jgi:phenylacetate-coenzyme A ligase PaaK-like adenylate-forming protein/acyl carrier protein